jgi:16S rRNA (cytosine967-C5)-methyltransferase
MTLPSKRPIPSRVDPTRDGAFDLLDSVLVRHRALDEALGHLSDLDPRDRAAAHRIAASVLRRLGSLDAIIEPHLKKAPPDPVRNILRIGAASLVLLETPAHAAVATCVDMARRRGLIPFAGLVNAVLRRVSETGAETLEQLDGPRLDTPAWLWTSWGNAARGIAKAHLHEAPLDISLLPGATPPEGGEMLPTGSYRLPAGTRVPELAGFDAGQFWVQDAAAALPAMLLNAQKGERIADLCAAPGGKTAQLAATGADVTAIELHAPRIVRLRENLARLNLNVDIVQGDAMTWRPADKLDAILLDAPCSATGTIRRHPDVAHLKRPRDLLTLAPQQDRLLDAACDMLRVGGRLIYAVCSLQPEEAAARVEAACVRLLLKPMPFTADELPGLAEAITPQGYIRTLPSMWPERGGMDGFFIARMVRI